MGVVLVHPELAYDYFYKRKWPNGFICPKCCFKAAYTISTRNRPLYQCMKCNHQTTLTAGTVMENTRTPLHKWMTAVKLICHPDSVNAVQLASILRVTYKTAFYMLQKIRKMLTASDRENPLSGNIRVSYTYPKSKYIAFPIICDQMDVPIMVAGSFDKEGNMTTLKLKPGLPKQVHTEYGINDFKEKHVGPACASFYFHEGLKIHVVEPLKSNLLQVIRWIGRAFRGVSKAYLEHYLDEYSFRYNRSMKADRIQQDICSCLMRNPHSMTSTHAVAA